MKRKRKILVIDDEKDFCYFVKFNLEHIGNYKVFTSTRAIKGVELAVRKKPDLIMLDIMMPGQDGLDILRALKRSLKTAAIPVIMLTALDQDLPKMMAGELYACDYLCKPIGIERMLTKLLDLIPES